jgi:hypothetical protein
MLIRGSIIAQRGDLPLDQPGRPPALSVIAKNKSPIEVVVKRPRQA